MWVFKMKKIILIIFCFGIFIVSCNNPFTNNGGSNTPGEFKNYTFEQQVICFCAPPAGIFFKLTVRDSQIVSAENTETGEMLEARQFNFFKTIPELVELVNSIDEDSVAVLDVTYDEKDGYPTYVYIDYSAQIADEEIGYRSRNFERN